MLEPKSRTLEDILEWPKYGDKTSYLAVPRFQRKYDWDKDDQIDTLIKDVFSTLDSGRDYFFGPVIFFPKEKNRVEIVDGQQRFVTFVIFLRALLDYIRVRQKMNAFSEKQSEDVSRLILHDIEPLIYKGKERKPVIEISRSINSQFYQLLLLNEEPEKIKALENRKRWGHPAIKRLRNAYIKIWESLKEKYDSLEGDKLLSCLQELEETLEAKLYFVTMMVSSYDDAYTIFGTINYRGKPLTLSDLVKIVCFEKLDAKDEEFLERLGDDWDKIDTHVSDFGTFIWHVWVSHYPSCSKRDVFKRIEERFKEMSPDDAEDFIYRVLLYESEWYQEYENPEDIAGGDGKITLDRKKYLELLKVMNATRCYPLLLSIDYCADEKVITPEQANECLKRIASLTFWHSGICVRDARHLESVYHELALYLRENQKEDHDILVNHILETLSKQFPHPEMCRGTFFTKSFDRIPFAKIILRQIDDKKYGRREKAWEGSGKVNLEHILPQLPQVGSTWRDIFQDEDERKDYSGRLGNLTLLYGPYNREIGNKHFSEKRKIYRDSDSRLTQELTDYKNWDKKAINTRTEKLLEIAEQIWPIPS